MVTKSQQTKCIHTIGNKIPANVSAYNLLQNPSNKVQAFPFLTHSNWTTHFTDSTSDRLSFWQHAFYIDGSSSDRSTCIGSKGPCTRYCLSSVKVPMLGWIRSPIKTTTLSCCCSYVSVGVAIRLLHNLSRHNPLINSSLN